MEMDERNEIKGLEYLRDHQIEDMPCDFNKPFAFISYAHHDRDALIVLNLFKRLYKDFNLWIDIANIPYDESSWKRAARNALRNKNCVLAFFFRSEASMVRQAVADELHTIKKIKTHPPHYCY